MVAVQRSLQQAAASEQQGFCGWISGLGCRVSGDGFRYLRAMQVGGSLEVGGQLHDVFAIGIGLKRLRLFYPKPTLGLEAWD